MKVARSKTGNPYIDLFWSIIWLAKRDFIRGKYEHYLSAKYFFLSAKPEFDGFTADYYFEALGLDRGDIYKDAYISRKERYRDNKEPAIIYVCRETCSNGLPCCKKFYSLAAYNIHMKRYNHNRGMCKRDGCHNLAKIKYCSARCRESDKKGMTKERIYRYPVVRC